MFVGKPIMPPEHKNHEKLSFWAENIEGALSAPPPTTISPAAQKKCINDVVFFVLTFSLLV